jgi:hypothetical protein
MQFPKSEDHTAWINYYSEVHDCLNKELAMITQNAALV